MSNIHEIRARSRLRVAHVAHGLNVGGLEKLLVEFARNANRDRFSLRFISLGGRGTLAEDIEALGWPVTALNLPTGLRPRIVLRLARLFASERIDVVHTHDDRPLIYGAAAARLAGVPRVIHTKHYGFLATVTHRQNLLTSCAARLLNDFVCVSHHGAELSRECGVPAAKLRTIWNGIDVRRFAFHGPCPQGPIVTVARLSPEKGLDTLLHAAALVIQQQPDLRFQLAGNGPCRSSLEQLARDLKIDSNVQFLGEVRDIPALLRTARLFVLPSLAEGVSLTLLEAMASGLPVVATKVGGNPEVVEDGVTGTLVDAQDPPALADAILSIANQPARGADMGRAGRVRIEEHFDVRSMVASYELLYGKRGRARSGDLLNPLILSSPPG